MKRLMDIHTHAVASGHAYSTVDENLRWAAEQDAHDDQRSFGSL